MNPDDAAPALLADGSGASPAYRFDRARLVALAEAHRESYQRAVPFPHTVIDGLVPDAVLDEIVTEFPSPADTSWKRFNFDRERKLASTDATPLGDTITTLLAELNSAVFIDFLQSLTGISGLVVDPHLHGGGLHQIEPGGFLDVHADFNVHPGTGLERRLNLLLYLNRDWRDEWGGALELWDREMRGCQVSVTPAFNRCVIFTTSDHSFHGHPQPLRSPPGVTRKSLALYYYSLPRGESTTEHNTLWRPSASVSDLGSIAQEARSTSSDAAPTSTWRTRAERWGRDFVPPLVLKAAGRLRRAWRSRRDR